MANMSVYRQHQKMFQLDHLNCVAGTATTDDAELIDIALENPSRAVLIGLDGENAIIKRAAEGDEKQSFEALYDDAFTASDLAYMHRVGATTPDKAPDETFSVSAAFVIEVAVPVKIALRARTNGGTGPRLRDLLRDEPMLREGLRENILRQLEAKWDFDHEIIYRVIEAHAAFREPIEPPLRADEAWRIL